MKPTILLIDDEKLVMQFHVRALQGEGFTVIHRLGPDKAFEFLEENPPDLDVVIVDLMMPPENKYKNVDTDEGLTTGIFVYQDVRAMYPQIPILIFTNVSNQQTLARFQEDELLTIVQKLGVSPFELVQKILGILETDRQGAVVS